MLAKAAGRFADVVVTAIASTTSLAPDAEETWALLLEGRSGIRPSTNRLSRSSTFRSASPGSSPRASMRS